ncbi:MULTISPECIES: hypothetical protein [unclassified Streptomyces]
MKRARKLRSYETTTTAPRYWSGAGPALGGPPRAGAVTGDGEFSRWAG